MIADIVIIALLAADIVLTMVLMRKTCIPSAADILDKEVEDAVKEAEKDLISEGFENIMSFEVAGHNGFDK